MIRFSLTTLLIVAFWAAVLMLVWAWRQPWYVAEETRESPWNSYSTRSPDDTRSIVSDDSRWGIYWHKELGDWSPLVPIYEETSRARGMFVDDETLVGFGSAGMNLIYRRRFPEWWWGHLYRPEVWLAIAMTGILIWRGLRRLGTTLTPKISGS